MDIGYEILRLHRQAGKLGKHPPRHSSPGRKQEENIEEKQSITI